MLVCKQCKIEIMEGTDAAKNGVCIPCSEEWSLFDDESKNIRKFQKHLDVQYIKITRKYQTKKYVDYEITSLLLDIDPRYRSRNIKVGSSTGILRIDKNTGDIIVVYPITHDQKGSVLARAERKLKEAFENGELPEKTCWASG